MSDSTLSRLAFLDKLVGARRGEYVTYHVGSVIRDRARGLDFLRVHGTATAAWEAYEKGICTLVQRTIGIGEHQYMAQKL